MPRIADVLERESRTVDLEPGDFERLLGRRERKERNRRFRAGAVGVVVALAVGAFLTRSLSWDAIPADPAPQPPSGQVLELTATIGGAVTVSSPRDWYLVDHWPATDSEIHPPTEEPLVLFEVANFDPGLSNAVCPAEPGGSRSLPADGIAISVTLGPASDVAGRCAGAIEDVRTGDVRTAPASDLEIRYTAVVAAGPDASDRDRATAAEILDSIEPTDAFALYRTGRGHAAYVIEAWSDGSTTSTLEARPSNGRVELSLREIEGWNISSGDSIEVSGSQPIETPAGFETFGAVTDDVARVELHRAGIDEPFVAERIELPPSLDAGFDAFVFEPQPEGGPFEVVAFGTDGEVLFSSLPPLTDTERVGTVRAFGATWAVKLSTAADGYWGATCVEPAATSTLEPCERGWGDGSLVQTFETPVPAVFVTQYQGVDAIDVVTDDGRRYPAVMIPTGEGASVAVVALEGAGTGRFVYQYDGKIDEGRRPEARVEWSDVGQATGDVRAVNPR
ncbi:MAG TPA: hypothetical protein VK867_13785 [Candidatus Limnocylindrales bacterium]|nr:hypothetical protein [Candidatus Limnocylindrales bacterium]